MCRLVLIGQLRTPPASLSFSQFSKTGALRIATLAHSKSRTRISSTPTHLTTSNSRPTAPEVLAGTIKSEPRSGWRLIPDPWCYRIRRRRVSLNSMRSWDLRLSISPVPGGLVALEIARQREKRSEEHTSELQSHHDLVCRLL